MGIALHGLRCAVSALALVGGGVALAGPIDLDDFSGSETVIDFTPGFGFQGGPFTFEGVTFSETGGGTGGPGFEGDIAWGDFGYFSNVPGSGGAGFNDFWGSSHIIMELPPGNSRVGVFMSTTPVTTWTMNLYNSADQLIGTDTRTMPGDSQAVFIGYETNENIARVEIVETNGENGHISLMDDVRFEAGSGGGPSINVGGSCPGTVTVNYSGFTPNTQVGIVFASNTGNVVIPNGPCAGTQLGLGAQNLQLVNTFNSGSGSGQVQGQAGVSACGGFLQLVEAGSCATSNVDQIP